MKAIVLGVGDTFSEQYCPTSFLLEHEGFFLAIDCPDGYRRVLKEASDKSDLSLDIQQIDDVLITHVHGDHMNGLEGFAFYKKFAQQKKVRLHCSKEVRESIWEERLKGSMKQLWNGHELMHLDFEDYFQWFELRWSESNAIGPFEIETRRTKHHVPTSALKISCEGKTLGYSCDTAFDPSLIEWLWSCDQIIHETKLGPSHTASSELFQLPAELRAKMHLVHHVDGFDESQSTIALAREGQVLTFGNDL